MLAHANEKDFGVDDCHFFASHNIGDRVEFNTGLIGGTAEIKIGVITEMDGRGTACIRGDFGEMHRDLCVLRKPPQC